MDVNELMQQTRDTLNVSRLFGEPYERNGTVESSRLLQSVVAAAADTERAPTRMAPEPDPAPAAASAWSPSLPGST